MPLYYVHVVVGERICKDPEGIELSDEATARDYVREDARDLLRHMPPADWAGCELVVLDGSGKELFSVPLLDVMPSDPQQVGTGDRSAD